MGRISNQENHNKKVQEYINNDYEELYDLISFVGHYSLMQSINPSSSKYKYIIIDHKGDVVSEWESFEDCLSLPVSQFKNNFNWKKFMTEVQKSRNLDTVMQKKIAERPVVHKEAPVDLFDDEADYKIEKDYYGTYNGSNWYPNSWSRGSNWNPWKSPSKPQKDYTAELNKSDTLVIHRTDSSTTMLRQIYEGKGWDVLNDSFIDKDQIHKLLTSHDKILMLGHGSANGLIGGNITPTEAPYLKDKQLFVIWCNADAYFNHYLPDKHGFYCTGNMPSDANEAHWVGFNVSQPYMDENITYWCKLCGDVAEQALNGDAEGAVKYIRDKYWEKYGQGYDVNEVSDDSRVKQDIPDEVRITKYNWVRTKVQ